MNKLFVYIKTVFKLGIKNCSLIFFYKTFKNLKIYKFYLKLKNCPSPNYLINLKLESKQSKNIYNFKYQKCIQKSEKIINGYFDFIGQDLLS